MAVIGDKVNKTQTAGKVKVKETSTEVLKANENRSGSQYVNASAFPVYLQLGKAAVAEEGIFLVKEGGSWNGMIGPLVWTGKVFGIAVGGEAPLTVIEV